MMNPKTNDNHRKGIDRWDDEGGAPPSPKRSPQPDPANPLPNPLSFAAHVREDAAPRPRAKVGHPFGAYSVEELAVGLTASAAS
jgi:hypothetical protein